MRPDIIRSKAENPAKIGAVFGFLTQASATASSGSRMWSALKIPSTQETLSKASGVRRPSRFFFHLTERRSISSEIVVLLELALGKPGK